MLRNAEVGIASGLTLAVLGVLSSCTGENAAPEPTPCTRARCGDTGQTVVINLNKHADEAFYPASIVRGRLTERAGCLLVANRAAVWSADFGWDASSSEVVWPDGALAVGDNGVFGGGSHPIRPQNVLSTDELFSQASAQALTKCLRTTGASEWVVLTPPES